MAEVTECVYGRVGETPLKLLVQKPKTWQPGDRRTAIVWIHGGGWNSGCAEQFKKHMEYFSNLGAVDFSIQYRLQTESVTMEDSLADCRSAIRYLRGKAEEFGIDSDKIIGAGDSAGGHFACCLGNPEIVKEEKERVNLVLDFNGVVDLTRKFRKNLLGEEAARKSVSLTEWKEQYDRAYAISPALRVCRGHAPVLVMQGMLDRTVEPEDSVQYHYALKRAGCDSTLVLLPDVSHAFILFDYHLEDAKVYEILGKVRDFLTEKQLLNPIWIR